MSFAIHQGEEPKPRGYWISPINLYFAVQYLRDELGIACTTIGLKQACASPEGPPHRRQRSSLRFVRADLRSWAQRNLSIVSTLNVKRSRPIVDPDCLMPFEDA